MGALDVGALIGRVRRVLVDPDQGKIAGFLIKEKGFSSRPKVVSMIDVIDVERAAMVINSRESLVTRGEIVRIAKILEYKFNIIGLPARTREGQMLGKITDVVVDSATGEIVRLYTKFLLQHRVFERSQIDEITWQEIFFKIDNRKKVKEKIPVAKEAEATG